MRQPLIETLCLLPESLRERTRVLESRKLASAGEFVLYWMRTAIRIDENPAFDVALEFANQLGIPAFIYQGLSERYRYASDRHHAFILQGARDVQAQCEEQDIGYAFHLECHQNRGSHLISLADRAAVVVTEDMPVHPLLLWTTKLSHATQCPIVAVDTACVVPMQLVGKAYERAFEYRNATRKLYDERIDLPSHRTPERRGFFMPDPLPFQPLDLQGACLSSLIRRCDIDHSVGPVPHTIGGSTAGYERWNVFRQNGLEDYARHRDDALREGVSRMSPYLHYGMVSPLRLAREAKESDSEGAKKYLDELLIWRELAYAFCFHRRDHETISALPNWAVATLAEHAADERPDIPSWETLARGRTGDELWDAAQQSLLIHGELHNNVRMTWGKAFLKWTPDATSALAALIDLNHRYALDGRDPASYGGLLWCLGQFDRPFSPPRPIYGSVRSRPTGQHATRLDLQAFRRKTTRPLRRPMPTVAVVGAGISGLICARTLLDHGFEVTVFEKSRGVGGRMATRRTENGLRFDHGAQYFTSRDERFRRYVDSWLQDGIVKPWRGPIVVVENGCIQEEKKGTERYVATPGMNAICKHLSLDLDVRFHTQVAPLERQGKEWHLSDGKSGAILGNFDVSIVSAPAGQSARLLQAASHLANRAGATEMHECWAVLLAFSKSLELPFVGAFVHDSPLSWIACNSAKPDRESDSEQWILHASANWSHQHIEESAEDVLKLLFEEFWKATGVRRRQPLFKAAHRWRFALPPEPLNEKCLFDRSLQIGACGDWCDGPRVEGAFLSGMAAAGEVLRLL